MAKTTKLMRVHKDFDEWVRQAKKNQNMSGSKITKLLALDMRKRRNLKTIYILLLLCQYTATVNLILV